MLEKYRKEEVANSTKGMDQKKTGLSFRRIYQRDNGNMMVNKPHSHNEANALGETTGEDPGCVRIGKSS